MKNPDTRVQFTRNALKQALLTLKEEKNVDKITVKELCETAGINRGTFYLHYDSPSALLADIENQFLEENLAIFRSYWKTQRDRNLMTELFLCIRKSGDFCRILMGPTGDPQILRRLQDIIRDGVLDEWQKEFPAYDRRELDFLFDYVFSGSMTLTQAWLENPRGLSADEFSRRMERLGHYSLLAVAEF